MARLYTPAPHPGDDENGAFEPAGKIADHKPGFERAVEPRETDPGHHQRLQPDDEKSIPRESLAARIAKIQKEG